MDQGEQGKQNNCVTTVHWVGRLRLLRAIQRWVQEGPQRLLSAAQRDRLSKGTAVLSYPFLHAEKCSCFPCTPSWCVWQSIFLMYLLPCSPWSWAPRQEGGCEVSVAHPRNPVLRHVSALQLKETWPLRPSGKVFGSSQELTWVLGDPG